MTYRDIEGGSAHKNGVSFFTKSTFSKATTNGDIIEVEIEEKEQKFYSWIQKLQGVPFIRGFSIFAESSIPIGNRFLKLLYLFSFSLILLRPILLLFNLSTPIILSSMYLIITVIIAMIAIKFTSYSKFHGAEHMVYNAYKSG
ncbi:hypothetical protein EEL31_09035 [Brevibacillus laterosporus]|nr:hypothetical protein [Brevibacillus laterosporus]TPG68652.1 hypothetical protein EEL31_09035 [Brevibacillus laterosporus]